MLTRRVAAPGDAGQRGRANRMIVASPVKDDGLVPDLIRNLLPTEPSIDSLRVHGLVQRDGVKVASRGSRLPHIAPVETSVRLLRANRSTDLRALIQ